MNIHPTAIIEEGARLAPDCTIHAHALITRYCELGAGVTVHPFAVVGGDPQDLSFKPATPSAVRIGAGTVIREHVTISRATKADQATVIGAHCFLMAACHIAHDCQIGDHVIIANAVLLAGHVHVGERAFLGGGATVHQFVRIGEGAMVSGGSRMAYDVPPFSMCSERSVLHGLNVVGLRRRGMAREVVAELKRACRGVAAPVGNPREFAAAALREGEFHSAEARRFLEFYLGGRRGFARGRGAAAPDGAD